MVEQNSFKKGISTKFLEKGHFQQIFIAKKGSF